MPLIQVKLTDEQSEKLEHYKILKKLRSKEEVIQELIDALKVKIKIER